jgi:indole-3-glycerol phosphate synthase
MSVSKVARRRGAILDEIMAYHRDQLPRLMRQVPLSDLRALASVAPPALDFRAALMLPGVSFIAECKKASPSKGLLDPRYDPVGLARTYIEAGARAISVLTDGRHFQGSLEDLRDVKEATQETGRLVTDKQDPRRRLGVPLLRKDFIFHPYHVYEARAAGADAILLIAAVLGPGDLRDLLALARELGMEALVEVHNEDERALALEAGSTVVGINNRDLQTFEVDLQTTVRLKARIPQGVTVVAESGIRSAEDMRLMRAAGVDAVLVGEALVRSKNRLETARQLIRVGR